MTTDNRMTWVREVRDRLARAGPPWTRGPERDFETVTLPERDCELLRDLLVAERARTVVEQEQAYHNVGWDLLRAAGLDSIATLIAEPSAYRLVPSSRSWLTTR